MKEARGTLQKCRDGVDTIESVSPALAMTPPELPLAVADVWAEYVAAAISHGAKQCDADSFAEWCTMTAVLRQARNQVAIGAEGEEIPQPAPAPASYVQQWRQLGELFGLVGAKSRVGGRQPGDKPRDNPFARNGRPR